MRQEDMNLNPNYFSLGPFEVRHFPHFHGLYSRYIITANGVPVRYQISYPEVEDGWQGIAFETSNHTLTEEQDEAIALFKTKHFQSRVPL